MLLIKSITLRAWLKKDIPMLIRFTKDNYMTWLKARASFQRAKMLRKFLSLRSNGKWHV